VRLLGGGQILFCYEAGPCDYGLYRRLLALGQDCEVVVPPKRGRIKTDRRDALKLEHAWQQVVLQEYIEAVRVATAPSSSSPGSISATSPPGTS